MEYADKIVDFEQYCEKCKHFYKDSIEEPCNECLTNPVNEHSHKPVNFEEGE